MSVYRKAVGIFSKKPFIVKNLREFFGNDTVNNSNLNELLCRYLAHRCDSKRQYGNLRLNIETTLACNARCIMCSRNSHPLKVGTMSDELFRRIIKDAKEIGVKKIILSIYGEPLLDPRFLERAKVVDEADIEFSFYTNGSLLNDHLSNELLCLKNFHRVSFSVNGFGKETYEEIMVGLDRDEVYTNVLEFLKIKERMRPDISVIISCVLFSKNIHEMKEFKKFWQKQKGVEYVYFPAIRDRAGTLLDIEDSGESVEFSPLSKKTHKLLPCKLLWEDLFIYWNGDIGVCCEDTASRRIITGNLNKQSLGEVWLGDKIKALRKLHLDGNRHLSPVCGKLCHYNTVWLKP